MHGTCYWLENKADRRYASVVLQVTEVEAILESAQQSFARAVDGSPEKWLAAMRVTISRTDALSDLHACNFS